MRIKKTAIVALCLILPMLLTYRLDLYFKRTLEIQGTKEPPWNSSENRNPNAGNPGFQNEQKEETKNNEAPKEETPQKEIISYRLGDTGDKIKEIQRNLNRFNYKIPVDGVFGNSTLWAVKDFQGRNKLPQDGVVGEKTLYKLSLNPTKETTYAPPKTGEKAASSTSTAEAFVNEKAFSSPTNYLIWVDTKKQHTYIFIKDSGRWKLHRDMKCATGKSSTPTVKGTFKVTGKGSYFRVDENIICKYYTQFYGNYLFHTVLLNNEGKVVDGRLGMKLSHGCVRLAIENAKYIYDNIPIGTTVFVN